MVIAVTLNQAGYPVIFFSPTKQNHASLEKEARAIIEAMKKQSYYLSGQNLQLLQTNRLSIIFHLKRLGKIKITKFNSEGWN